MTKMYYRNEYTAKQWKALIDKVMELGCKLTYNKYGDRAEIDSTDLESRILQNGGRSADDCAARSYWAEALHNMLQESTDLRRWKVQPKRRHKGYGPIICNSQKFAEHEQERAESATGFEWTIIVIPE